MTSFEVINVNNVSQISQEDLPHLKEFISPRLISNSYKLFFQINQRAKKLFVAVNSTDTENVNSSVTVRYPVPKEGRDSAMEITVHLFKYKKIK